MPPSKQSVLPEPSVPNETRSEASPDHEPGPFWDLALKIYTKVLALFTSIRLGEKGIPPGYQRIRWTNKRGKRLYDDYVEHEPGALQALQEFLNASAYRTRMTPEGDHTSSPSGLSYTFNSSLAWVHSSNSSDIADQMRKTVGSSRSNYDRKDAELGEMSTRTLHLLSCMEKGGHSVELHQEIITNVTDDRQLFHTLRRSYHEHRGRFRPYWSLRTVHSIHFMKFAYGGRRYIDVRCHDDICENGKPCDCIPPADLVHPIGTEYECYPIPSKLSPPVGQRLMMDFFTDPDGIEPNVTLVTQQLPKRICGELRSQSFGLVEAWGIYYKEDWDWAKIWWVIAIGFFPPSLLFGILWGILKKDIQGAFGVASWWMTGATILVGIVGTCTWTL
ncbi:hypothetical protein DM02DRAFT_546931 [Periconia macrospinosa]|uniref:Uncharacterized protein n=1 Tax=Periconia macrospinosa TaxID=97972 RepID=A0A2V1CYS2_9PLEO|nr:hypothetical protein DM02DRAFT_546931 [Periconia macrospinosa]